MASKQRLAVLRHRDFALYFAAQLTSRFGSAMVPVALTFAVLDNGYRATGVGLVLAAEAVPLVLLLLVAGVIADGLGRRRVMVVADVACALSEAVLAGLLLAGHPPLWAIMVAAGVLGAGQAFYYPARLGFVAEIVPADQLQEANALRGLAYSGSGLVGPAISGLLVAAGGAGVSIAVDAATFAVSAACLLRVRRMPPAEAGGAESMVAQLRTGWDEFRSRTWLWVIVVQFGFMTLVAVPSFMVIGAVVARRSLGGAPAWGLILAGQAAGSIVGGLVSLHVRPRRPMLVATLATATFAIPNILVAVPVAALVVAASGLVMGAGGALFGALWETTLQRQVPPRALSRVGAYDALGSTALMPVGYAVIGPLAAVIGDRAALLAGAAVIVVSSLCVLAVPSVRHLVDDAQPATAL